MKPWPFLHSMVSVSAAVGVVLVSSLILILLRQYLSSTVVALLYIVPVVISSALWGSLAGTTASALSFVVFLYFFVPPYYTFQIAHPQDFLVMIVLLSVAVLTSSLMARIQSNLARVQAREREAAYLYELSVDLIGKNQAPLITRILAERLAGFFTGAAVEVEAPEVEGRGIIVRVPADHSRPFSKTPVRRIPLSTPHHVLGEIRIWNISETLPPEAERLLQTFASQGALALDRAALAASETRAGILEESDRLKTAILSSVSHELRTPLASIQASATSLFNPAVELEPEARADLQSLLLEEIDTMSQLVGNLLNMSRIEAGPLKLQRQWNSIAEIVDTSVRRLQRLSRLHRIEVEVSEDLPLVSVDSVLMEQVMINLIRNSLKFSPLHSTIRIQAGTDDQTLKIIVSNEGPTIAEEHLAHIFEKFYPIPGKDAVQGTGLGLSICKGIVEAHDGKIWAENLPVGVAFNISIPLAWDGARPVLPGQEGWSNDS